MVRTKQELHHKCVCLRMMRSKQGLHHRFVYGADYTSPTWAGNTSPIIASPWAQKSQLAWPSYFYNSYRIPSFSTSLTPRSYFFTKCTWITSSSSMTPHAPTQITFCNILILSTATSSLAKPRQTQPTAPASHQPLPSSYMTRLVEQ